MSTRLVLTRVQGEHQGWSAAQTPLITRTWFGLQSAMGEHQAWSTAPTPLIQRTWLSTKLVCRLPESTKRQSRGAQRLVCSTDTPDPENLVEYETDKRLSSRDTS